MTVNLKNMYRVTIPKKPHVCNDLQICVPDENHKRKMVCKICGKVILDDVESMKFGEQEIKLK